MSCLHLVSIIKFGEENEVIIIKQCENIMEKLQKERRRQILAAQRIKIISLKFIKNNIILPIILYMYRYIADKTDV